MCHIVVEVVIVPEQCLVMLIHIYVAVHGKSQSVYGWYVMYRRYRSSRVQAIQVSLPLISTYRYDQLKLTWIVPKQCSPSHVGSPCDISHAHRLYLLVYEQLKCNIKDLSFALVHFLFQFFRISHILLFTPKLYCDTPCLTINILQDYLMSVNKNPRSHISNHISIVSNFWDFVLY